MPEHPATAHEWAYFRNQVPEEGFRLVDGWNDAGKRVRGLVENEGPRRLVEPDPALFRTFAALPEEDARSILAFADEHGPLGVLTESLALSKRPRRKKPRPSGQRVHAEPLATWAREILAVREAVELAKAIEGHDQPLLRRWITANDQGAVYDHPSHAKRGFAGRKLFPRQWARVVAGEDFREDTPTTAAARLFLQEIVNERLAGPLVGSASAVPQLLWDPQRRRFDLHVVPDGLLSAIWLQVARYVDSGRSYRECALSGCGNWYEAFGRRRFCSNTHKTTHNQRKRALALELHGRGKKPAAIAREVETSAAQVRKWIRAARSA